MEKLKLEETYEGGLSASIDWVAGGNFDGYVYRKTLRFSEHNIVRMNTIILDQSRYDGEADNAEMIGHHEASDHKTITCTFPVLAVHNLPINKMSFPFSLLPPRFIG